MFFAPPLVLREAIEPLLRRQHTSPASVRLRQLLVLLGCLAATAGFLERAIHGRHGLDAHHRLLVRAEALEVEIAGLDAVRARLAHDVDLLAAEPPASDMVETVARDTLGFTDPGDVILRR